MTERHIVTELHTAPSPVAGEQVIDTSPATGDTVKTTTCYMCACRCGIKVHLKDGQVRYIEGNRDHPVNKGVLCAKGSAGIMTQLSPAKLRKPLLRVGERGEGKFREIEWDEAMGIATMWLSEIRARDPKRLAFFTGRDQSQALTGWWAAQFGTLNYAAHGGFCSVNMAAAGLYTIGGSFWEFGEPDWERTRYFMMFGIAEDHDSNPIKIGLGRLKGRPADNRAKFVSVNPVRTGYSAIADEWIGLTPGTDGLFVLSLVHELMKADRIDLDFLVRYTNAPWLVIEAPGTEHHGLIARDAEGNPLCADSICGGIVSALKPDIAPRLVGEFDLPDGKRARPVFELMARRYLDPKYAPENVAATVGIDAATIRRIAAELAHAAFEQAIEIKADWTDWAGRKHDRFIGRPVSMHAMRGISAHSNGFDTCRAIHLLQMLLGSIDCPGGFRYKPPFPRAIPVPQLPHDQTGPLEPLKGSPLGFPLGPEHLLVDENGKPKRIDKAFSWEAPLSAHGLMHMVIHNAWAGDPYPIDTLFMYMANMAWNSTMNPGGTMAKLADKDPKTGEYKIPHFIYADAYYSETVAYADLVLPDTTYLERWDCISLLDRPICDADGAADSIRQPVLKPDRDVRPFQDVLLDLGARLGLKPLTNEDGTAKYPGGLRDYLVNHQRRPGIGMLSGWRGEAGDKSGRGEVNPNQLERYIENGCFWRSEIPDNAKFFRHANADYFDWAINLGLKDLRDQIVLQIYSEPLRKFQLAGEGFGEKLPPEADRARLRERFDPLPEWHPPFGEEESDRPVDPSPRPSPSGGEGALLRKPFQSAGSIAAEAAQLKSPSPPPTDVGLRRREGEGRGEGSKDLSNKNSYPLHAITQRPMHMYHSWGSQNAWLRQIQSRNALFVNRETGEKLGLEDGDWVWIESPHGRVKAPVQLMEGVNRNTVWTWNAIGKRAGAWNLAPNAPESQKGFLLNHVISELLPPREDGYRYSNSDPVTGQAAWYDLKVRLVKCSPEESGHTAPEFKPLQPPLKKPASRLQFGAAFRKRREAR